MNKPRKRDEKLGGRIIEEYHSAGQEGDGVIDEPCDATDLAAQGEFCEKSLRLYNSSCIYCGNDFTISRRSKEHVIGRNFVPKGSFRANDWIFIAWACDQCNYFKSTLEGEISAITLQPQLGAAHSDPIMGILAERKAAKARCEATGRTVRDSRKALRISLAHGSNATIALGFIAPPQMLQDRVRALAQMHIQAFYYWLTYDKFHQRGELLPNGIVWFTWAQKADWGNAQFRHFAAITECWNCLVSRVAGADYFRVEIKHNPSGKSFWSFALEWNRNCRVIGFFGDKVAAEEYTAHFPPFAWVRVNETYRMREETALNGPTDNLFTGFGVSRQSSTSQAAV